MNSLLLAGAAWLATFAAPSSNSDQLRRERLPADVDFVVHFDMEGFRQTQLWRHIESQIGDPEFSSDFDDLHELKSRFGIDPFVDVRAVTLFKVKGEEDPTVVLFSTTPKVDEALRNFQRESGYARIMEGGIELHTWREHYASNGDDDESAYAYLHSGANLERVVVLSSNKTSALRAARVLRGEEASHARSGALLTIAPAPGSFMYMAAAQIPHLDEFTPASHVLGLAQGIQVDLGEAGGFLRGHMGVVTGSPEDALNISNVVNGLISLIRLAGAEAGEALELLTGLRLNTRGSEVMVDFEFGVGRLLEIIASLDQGDGDEGDGDEEHDEVEVK